MEEDVFLLPRSLSLDADGPAEALGSARICNSTVSLLLQCGDKSEEHRLVSSDFEPVPLHDLVRKCSHTVASLAFFLSHLRH